MALKEYIGISRLTQAFTLLKGIFDTKEDTPEQITKQQWDALTPAQQESGDYIVIGFEPSPSGGHAIQNASGTDLMQRDTLQFKGGLKATDDPTNEKTVVDGTADEITWTEYNNLTPEQQSALDNTIVTDVPGADGTISADLMTKLWENPSPTASFAQQQITLSSADYDFLVINCKQANDSSRVISTMAPKGQSGYFSYSLPNTNTNVEIVRRGTNYIDATHIEIEHCYSQTNGSSRTTTNERLIPFAVYGIKKTVTVKFDALARDVSTSASKCMLSDGVTSVEGAIDELNADKADKDLSNVTGTLPVANGGTGATTAANARTNLGLGGASTQAVANNLTTTSAGYVLDARQGKALNDKITNNATAGTTVALSNNTNYRAPNDGYVHITTNAGYPAFIYLRNNSYQNIAVQSCYNPSSGMQASIFVRKGIIIYPTFTANQGSANFTPVTVS